MPVSQAQRQVSITSALGADALLFSAMSASEQLGRLSEVRVQLVSDNHIVSIADVLGKPMTVTLDLSAGAGVRHFNGIVTRFSSTGWRGDLATYEATLHPWLWLLKKSSNCRIFQEKSVTDIIKEVCAKYGGAVSLSLGALTGDYPALTYCVQYRETDFDFVCRLMEDAGIYFYFTHTDTAHTMVLADSFGAHQLIAGYAALKFAANRQAGGRAGETISEWSAAGEIQSSDYALNDYNFEKQGASVSGGLKATSKVAAGFGQPDHEMYDYPGRYVDAGVGTKLALARIERLHGQCEQIDGRTDARGLFVGGVFGMAEHPRADQERKFLVTSARYQISGGEFSSGGADAPFEFDCKFTAIGHEHAYRPPAIIARPVVQGPQTAMVVGKAGEEIWTDKYGRVKVQFHWDRLGKEDENTSCWVRVSQSWAGKGWGAMAIPRIGMEVVVSFLEGDPDRPLITGCVYNSTTMPPYDLPANQTRSTFKSQSSKGGEGFNEIRFEDKKGEEEVFVHAERDFNRVVKNNDSLKVGFETADKGDQSIAIKNDQTLEVGNDQSAVIKNDQKLEVGNDQTGVVKNDQKLDVGNDQTVKIDGGQKVKVGTTIVIEAGTSIELKVGGSSIKIEAAKITIKSAEIEIAADANAKVKAGAMMDLKAGAILTASGALVKIN